uniref:Secreted protein n=1 Tax=Steinernema glaseri TaxID=37863 RepID=A0A1I8A8Y9_9BILA
MGAVVVLLFALLIAADAFTLGTFQHDLYRPSVNEQLVISFNVLRAKRQYCLNYPCPPGSTAYWPNWGYWG